MNVSAIFWYDVNVTEFPLWFLAHLSLRVIFLLKFVQFVYEQAQLKMFGRFKFIQIMTPMYNQRNSNDNDVKLILIQAIIQIFPKITCKGF